METSLASVVNLNFILKTLMVIEPQFLDLVVEISRRSSALIMDVYHSGDFGTSHKDDQSPLTRADMLSHKLIVSELQKHWDFPVVSEEDPVDYSVRKNWETFWLIDPLDGTKDFVAKNGEFTVNIALVHKKRPVLGVVAIPNNMEVYAAIKGGGAFKFSESGKIKIFNHGPNPEIICSESRFHRSPKTEEFCRKHGISKILSFGSALKLCKMAEGVVHVYPRYQPTCEWDTAAGDCILSEAGCSLCDMATNQLLCYNKEDIRNMNGFFACHDSLLPLFLASC